MEFPPEGLLSGNPLDMNKTTVIEGKDITISGLIMLIERMHHDS